MMYDILHFELSQNLDLPIKFIFRQIIKLYIFYHTLLS